MGDVWDDARRFIRAESGLLMPVAFATIGLGTLLISLATPASEGGTLPRPGLWMVAMLPPFLLVMTGHLALCALALGARISVGEALRAAFARLPALILLILVGVFATSVVVVVASLAGVVIGAVIGGGPQRAAMVALALLLGVLTLASARLMPLLPLLVDRAPSSAVLAPIRDTLALTRRRTTAILGVSLLFSVATSLLVLASGYAGGALFLMIGKALGSPALGATLTTLLTAVVTAAVQAVVVVFSAMLYRRLSAGSSKGI